MFEFTKAEIKILRNKIDGPDGEMAEDEAGIKLDEGLTFNQVMPFMYWLYISEVTFEPGVKFGLTTKKEAVQLRDMGKRLFAWLSSEIK